MQSRISTWGRCARVLNAAAVITVLSLIHLYSSAAQAELEPRMPDLSEIVKDEGWAKALGKALFWDQQAGSDGMACASCHFHAGADSRVVNQLNPGELVIPSDLTFGAIKGNLTGAFGPNYEVTAEDFPFHKLAEPSAGVAPRNAPILSTTNDRLGSAGAFDAQFTGANRGRKGEECEPASGDLYHIGGLPTRQAEPRHTPTTINAVFFERLFWDGRANNSFNGVGVFGPRDIAADPRARVMVHDRGPRVHLEPLDLPNAALASQAVGPLVNAIEMSCAGRTLLDAGRRLLARSTKPLRKQAINAEDSLLGNPGPHGDLRNRNGIGLRESYRDLIEKAFHEKYWAAPGNYTVAENGRIGRGRGGYTQMEHNFALFWGVAIMLYESTLISDQSKFDRVNAANGGCMTPTFGAPCQPAPGTGFSELETDGFRLFFADFDPEDPSAPAAGCSNCHNGEMFSVAARTADEGAVNTVTRTLQNHPTLGPVETFGDSGFFNIGSRPTSEDLGLGGVDPYGNPLSYSRQYKDSLVAGQDGAGMADNFSVNGCPGPFGPFVAFDSCPTLPAGVQVEDHVVRVDGAFKTPSLRNVALTPPYFHYGGYANLEQVVDFYAHGGNRRDMSLEIAGATGDNSGTGPFGDGGADGDPAVSGLAHGRNVNDDVRELNLALDPAAGKDQQYGIDALVAFMLTLTDPRVQCDAAPFDHPQLRLFHGHKATDANRDGRADDVVVELPAVGQYGYESTHRDLCIPNAGDLFAPGMRARVGITP